jgi:hypothetical protein
MRQKYSSPMAEVIAIAVEEGFYLSQQVPSDWDDM